MLSELDVVFVATGGGNRGAGAVTGAADLHSHTSKPVAGVNSAVDTRACSPVLSIVSSQDSWTGGVHRRAET